MKQGPTYSPDLHHIHVPAFINRLEKEEKSAPECSTGNESENVESVVGSFTAGFEVNTSSHEREGLNFTEFNFFILHHIILCERRIIRMTQNSFP